jgi:ribosomal protein S9
LCESGLARAHDRGEAEPVRRGWARALLRWEDAWREGLRRRDGGCRGR